MHDDAPDDKAPETVSVMGTGRFPYYRRYQSDALRGMRKLTLEQRGAYDLILDLTYEQGGPIDDDDAYMAREANCSTRKWRALKAQLIALQKIMAHEGKLWNGRAMVELERTQRISVDRSEAARKGAKKRAETTPNSETKAPRKSREKTPDPSKNNAVSPANGSAKPQLPESISRIESSSTETSPAQSEPAPPPSPLIGGGGALEAQRQGEGKPSDKRAATRARFDAGAFAQRTTSIVETESEGEGATP